MQRLNIQKSYLRFLMLVIFGAVVLGLLASFEVVKAEDSYEYIRTYSSDDGRSQINVQTRSSSNSDSGIYNTIRAYSSSASDTSGSSHENSTFITALSGLQEVPPVSTVTTGQAVFEIDGDAVAYDLDVWNGENITAAHLHCAPKGTNGPVAASLFSSSGGVDINGALESGEITNNDVTDNCSNIANLDDLIDEMEDGEIYVNVHSAVHPDGLIRGQINGIDDDADDDPSPSRLIQRIEELLEIIRDLLGDR